MKKIIVAYNTEGCIVAAGEMGHEHANDRPQERPGIHVKELQIPAEHEAKKLHEYLHLLRVDAQTSELTAKE